MTLPYLVSNYPIETNKTVIRIDMLKSKKNLSYRYHI